MPYSKNTKTMQDVGLPVQNNTQKTTQAETNFDKYNRYKRNILDRRAKEVNSLISFKNESIRNIDTKIAEIEAKIEGKKDKNTKIVTYIKGKYNINKVQKHKDVCATSCPENNYLFDEIVKGKSTLRIFDKYANLKYKYGKREFWSIGYYVDTVGKNEKIIKEYIKKQLQEDIAYDQVSIQEYIDPFTGEKIEKKKSGNYF